MRLTCITIFTWLAFSSCGQTALNKRNVAVFIYEGVEILDFGGPSEVFAVSGLYDDNEKWWKAFNVYTVAATKDPVKSQGFISINPEYSIDDAPKPDIIILPGGSTSASRENQKVINWIRESSEEAEILLSVCTGAFLLGDAGLLKNVKATTWYGVIDSFRETFSETEVLENTRFVDNGQIVTTAGVSAGIDGALHVVSRLLGRESAHMTAKYMEYDKWEPEAGHIVAVSE